MSPIPIPSGSGRTSPTNGAQPSSPLNGSKPAIPTKPAKLSEPNVLLELADNISKTAAMLAKHINDNKLPQPSFDWDGPGELVPPQNRTPEIQEAQRLLTDSAMKMWELAYGAHDRLLTLHQTVSLTFENNEIVSLSPDLASPSSLLTNCLFIMR